MSAAGTARAHKPTWATGAYYTRELHVPGPGPTEFEQLVQRRGLEHAEHLWRYDAQLRAFARNYRKTRYVPEFFLAALGLDGEVEL
jgi:hypothetical protein